MENLSAHSTVKCTGTISNSRKNPFLSIRGHSVSREAA